MTARGGTARGLWLSWERHRRSRELAHALGTQLCELQSDAPWAARAVLLSSRTAAKLLGSRPDLLVVQNPSIILATVACLFKPLLGYRLIVDRHSNFFEETLAAPSFKFRIFHALSRYTVRRADLTIVTNDVLKDLLESWGGRGLVLPDKLPTLPLARPRAPGRELEVVFVCSHAFDEPVAAVIEAARLLGPEYRIHVTGDSRRSDPRLIRGAPANVTFTGFLDEAAYQSLLASSRAVLALTSLPNTLLCCAYEAVALGRPLVLSDQAALTAYFRKGTVATGHAPADIAAAVRRAVAEEARLREEVAELARELMADWENRFAALRRLADLA
ncbi:MAG: glycosyltransferase family protein [Candidatus Krumholzibacteriia bacterium]